MYQEVTKPAFYIPYFDYLQSIGQLKYSDSTHTSDIHLLNPSRSHSFNSGGLVPQNEIYIEMNTDQKYEWVSDEDGYIYIFVLGHNFKTVGGGMTIELGLDDTYVASSEQVALCNSFWDTTTVPDYNGFSIMKVKFDEVDSFDTVKVALGTDLDYKIGCISICSKWSPPHSPDLSLSMSREFDGISEIKSTGGATLTNARYTRGGNWWGTSYPWELYEDNYDMADPAAQNARTLGRRNWDLNFSYLGAGDIMPEIETVNYFDSSDSDGNAYTSNESTLLEDRDAFFSRVLTRVQGRHLPFIFQQNDTNHSGTSFNPDQWAICRFNQDNFKITQSAPSLYSMSMSLRESW